MMDMKRSGACAPPRWRVALLGVVALAAAGSVTACGSSSKTSTNATTSTSTTTSSSSSSGSSGSSGTGRRITVSSGVSLTLAPGWKVGKRDATVVLLANAAATVFYSIATGPSSGNAIETLKQDIQNDNAAAAEGNRDYMDVQVQGTPQNDPPPNTQKYDSGADVPFTAQGASGSGLTSVIGVYGELVDSTNQTSVLVIAYSGSQSDLEAAHAAIKSMNDSLLASS